MSDPDDIGTKDPDVVERLLEDAGVDDEGPRSVYDGLPINEYFWDWLDEVNLEPGDELLITTTTHSWETPMTVTNDPDKAAERDIFLESSRGTEYMLITYSRPHPIESAQPMVRKRDGFESKGVLERVELL